MFGRALKSVQQDGIPSSRVVKDFMTLRNRQQPKCYNLHPKVMTRSEQAIQDRYDVLLFAKSPAAARTAARELVRVVLGDEALDRPLEEAMRETWRILRPATDPRDQARFEEEFLELGIWPASQRVAA